MGGRHYFNTKPAEPHQSQGFIQGLDYIIFTCIHVMDPDSRAHCLSSPSTCIFDALTESATMQRSGGTSGSALAMQAPHTFPVRVFTLSLENT